MKGSCVIRVGTAKPPVRLLHTILLAMAAISIAAGTIMLIFQKALRNFFAEEKIAFTGYVRAPEVRSFPLFISHVTGQVSIRDQREVVSRPVLENMTVEEGAVVSTGEGASILINFEDVLALQLGALTDVLFERITTRVDDPAARTIQLYCERGEIFVASHLESPDATITIVTPTHTIIGRRARFEVVVTDKLVKITVLDGNVVYFLSEQPDKPITLLGGSYIAHPVTTTAEGKKIVVGTEEELAVREITEEEKKELEARASRVSALVRKVGDDVSPAFYEVQTKIIKEIIERCRKNLENFELLPCFEYIEWPLVLNEIPLDKRRLTETFLDFTALFETFRLEICPERITVNFVGREDKRRAITLFPGMLEIIYKGTGLKRSRRFLAMAEFVMVEGSWKAVELRVLEIWCPHVPYREK